MELVGLFLFIPFLVCLVLGVPIAFSLGLSCLVFLLFSGTHIPPLILITEMYAAIDSFALLALPMFVLTGELLNRCNLTEKLVEAARLLIGWIKGGLAHVNVVTSMFFAGISGSVLADAASIGPILIPAMIRERYPAAFSAAITGASSVIGAIIPPSIPLIIVGGQLQISIGGLFAAGVVPGILVGLFLMITAYIICSVKGYGHVHRFEGVVNTSVGTFKALPALMIPVLILGGILSGIFTPTEAGAIAVLYTLLVGAFYYRSLDSYKLRASLIATARVSASALLIVAAAIVFGRILTFYRLPQEISRPAVVHHRQPRDPVPDYHRVLLVHGHVHGRGREHDHPGATVDADCGRWTRHAPDPVWDIPDDRLVARRHHAAARADLVRGLANSRGDSRTHRGCGDPVSAR